ncbi:MAG: hypothetical protein V2A79_12410 [Planctomycetota bacterium]
MPALFDHWTGGVPAGHEQDNPLSLTMSTYKSVTAHFVSLWGGMGAGCDSNGIPDGCQPDRNANAVADSTAENQ